MRADGLTKALGGKLFLAFITALLGMFVGMTKD